MSQPLCRNPFHSPKSGGWHTILLVIALLSWASANPAHATSSEPHSQVPFGVNGDWDWMDSIKGVVGWNTVGNATSVPQDRNGWPQSDAGVTVFDNRKNMPYRGPDPVGINQDISGVYKLSLRGQATISANTESGADGVVVSDVVYNAPNNTTTANVNLKPFHWVLQLTLSNTKRSPTSAVGSGFTQLSLFRPGCQWEDRDIFTPATLEAYREPFASIRLLGPDDTNDYQTFSGSDVVTTKWADRVLVTDAYQSGLPDRNTGGKQSHGVAWEYMIQLANRTHHDMWINVPASADDDYVTQLANLIRNGNKYTAGLSPDLHVYVEYSNEVWNFGFQAAIYNQIKANAEGIGLDQRYIERTIQIAKLFQNAFGESTPTGRVRPVALWQYTQELTFYHSLGWAEHQFGQPVKDFIYGIGEAPYFNASDTSSTEAIFSSLWTGSDSTRRDFIGWKAVATFYGLKEVGYESGPSLSAGAAPASAIRSNRLTPIIQHHFLDNWFAVGGDVVGYFALRSYVSQFGDWLLVEDLEHRDTGTFHAAQRILSEPRPAITAGYVLPWSTGRVVTIDPSQRTADVFSPDATPGSGLNIDSSNPNVYLLRTSTSNATFSLTLFGHTVSGSGAVDILIDNEKVGTAILGGADATSTSVSFGLVSPGFHALAIATEGSDTSALPPGAGAINIQMVSGSGSPLVPSAPGNLSVKIGDGQASLLWATTSAAKRYHILRSTTSGGPFVEVGMTPTNTYTDSGLSNGQTYYYVVQASDIAGRGGLSPQLPVFPTPAGVPSTPGSLDVNSAGGDFNVFYGTGIAQVTWAPVKNASGYNIYRSTDGTNFSIVNGAQSSTEYLDLTVNNNSTYYYTVSALNSFGEGPQTAPMSTTPLLGLHPPPSLSVTQRNGFTFLSWTADPLTQLTFGPLFNIKRSSSSAGPFATIGSLDAYTAYDYTATPGKTYYYQVTQVNSAAESAASNTVEAQSSKKHIDFVRSYSSDTPVVP